VAPWLGASFHRLRSSVSVSRRGPAQGPIYKTTDSRNRTGAPGPLEWGCRLLAASGPRGVAFGRMDSPEYLPQSLLVATANPDRVPFSVELGREARRHLRALRLRDGATVRVTNGRGAMWEGRLEGIEGGEGSPACRLETALPVEPLLPVALAFGIAAKTRTLWLVEKAVELGVGVLQPIEFIRSASVADGARSPAFWSKARRRAEAALEQSGGAWLPELRDPSSLEAFLAGETNPATAPPTDVVARLFLTPSGERELVQWLTPWTGRSQLTLLVGPEGGLDPSERDAILANGFQPARLGGRMLRFETAAIAAVAVAGQHVAAESQVVHAQERVRAAAQQEEE